MAGFLVGGWVWWIGVVNFLPTMKQARDAIIYRQHFIFKSYVFKAYVYCVKKTAYTDLLLLRILLSKKKSQSTVIVGKFHTEGNFLESAGLELGRTLLLRTHRLARRALNQLSYQDRQDRHLHVTKIANRQTSVNAAFIRQIVYDIRIRRYCV